MSDDNWPVTDEEWREAVDVAYGALCWESAVAYGLVEGGPEVNTERCQEMLAEGAKHGFYPSPMAVEDFVAALAGKDSQ